MAPRILARRECSIWLRFLFFALAERRNNVGNKPRLINIDKEREVGGFARAAAFLTATLRGCPRPRLLGHFHFHFHLHPGCRRRQRHRQWCQRTSSNKKHASGVRTISRWGRSVSCTVMQSERLDCRAHGPEMESAVRGSSTSPRGAFRAPKVWAGWLWAEPAQAS